MPNWNRWIDTETVRLAMRHILSSIFPVVGFWAFEHFLLWLFSTQSVITTILQGMDKFVLVGTSGFLAFNVLVELFNRRVRINRG